MKIEHSPLLNDFLSFYFETSVGGEKLYETILDYTQMRWWTEEISHPENPILSGTINPSKDQAEEKVEEQRIRNVVTTHLLKIIPGAVADPTIAVLAPESSGREPKTFSAKAIVATIWEARKSKLPEEVISVQLARMGLTPEQAAHVFEMVEFSLNRAFMETLGGSHAADYDGDPYFKASLSRAREQYPVSPRVRRERIVFGIAVGAAVLIGLFAVGVVIYYAIDLFRASH